MLVEKIKKLCSSHGISIPKLEEHLNFGAGTISKWKKSAPGADKVLKVAEYFHVSTDYLLGKEEDAEKHTSINNALTTAMFATSEYSEHLFDIYVNGIKSWCNDSRLSEDAKCIFKNNAWELASAYKLLIEASVNAIDFLTRSSSEDAKQAMQSKERLQLFLKQQTEKQTQDVVNRANVLSFWLANYAININNIDDVQQKP